MGIYWVICYETWQMCSSYGLTKTLCGNCENCDYSTDYTARNVQKSWKSENLNIPRGAIIKLFTIPA